MELLFFWVTEILVRCLQEYLVPTSFGHISVTVCGDQDKPALVTYPDVGLNCTLQ